MKGLPLPFPSSGKTATPRAETSTVSAKGENGLWDDDLRDSGSREGSRARRELSVIEESSSLAAKEDGVSDLQEGEGGDVVEAREQQEAAAEEAAVLEEEDGQSGRGEVDELEESEGESEVGPGGPERSDISTPADD
jgi:hypothetical protein